MTTLSERCAEIAIGDARYQIASDDEYLSALGSAFEPHTTALFRALLKPGAVVADIGANIGCTSILFSQRARRVLSFEPSPTTFRYLERNIRNAGIRNVELHNLALGSEPGNSSLTFAPTNRAGGFVSDKTIASAGHAAWLATLGRTADGLLCISNAVADDLVGWLGAHSPRRASSLKIGVLPLGADLQESVPSRGLPENAQDLLDQIAARTSVLMVGTVEPRKGHDAYRSLSICALAPQRESERDFVGTQSQWPRQLTTRQPMNRGGPRAASYAYRWATLP